MIKETDLAARVIEWLESQHWNVYQEVSALGSVADIVAVQNRLVWIIECKTSLSLDLISQAIEWKPDAHFVSVAIPSYKNRHYSKARRMAYQILKHYGIGLIIVPVGGDINDQNVNPRLNRKATKHILSCLNEKQKHFAPAGTKGGGYWTPYKETCRRIVRIVNKKPGIILKDLIDSLDHHYANDKSAKSSISHWIQAGKIKGVRFEKEGKYLRFYPEKSI